MYVVAASRPRCLAVAIGLTAALWGVAAVLVRTLAARQPASPDAALVRLCLGALALAAGWAWLQAMAGVADAWRGTTAPPAPRRAPSGAGRLRGCARERARGTRPGRPRRPALRPAVRAAAPRAGRGPRPPPTPPVVVRPGDTLWALAERDLPGPATDRQVSVRWHAVYRRNRGVIGPDPDLIRPGQVLKLTKEQP